MANTKEYNRQYYQEHKDELNKRHKSYYEANKETILKKSRETTKRWIEDNREYYRQYRKEYYQAHKEEINAKRKGYEKRKLLKQYAIKSKEEIEWE